jgi:4-carboxymuconolactone decarboxylase
MPRMPYADSAGLSHAKRQMLDRIPANVIRMLAGASDAVFDGFGAFTVGFMGTDSPLPAQLREIAILRVGYLSNAAYEVFQHEALARHVGLTEAQIAAITTGGAAASALGEAGAAVLAFTDDLVRNVRASDETLAGVRRHLDDTQVIDLILVTGLYMMVSRFLETTGVEIDNASIEWKEITPAEA